MAIPEPSKRTDVKSLEYLMTFTSEQIVDLYRQHFAERDPERAAILKLEADFANLHWVNFGRFAQKG